MIITLKNKFLYFDNYKLRCSIGKRGITTFKKEGDQKTPRGTFSFKAIFYRKDRIHKINSSLKNYVIKKDMGWCDDPKSLHYNKLIKYPFDDRAERLWLSKKNYDVIIVINYNLKPIIKNKGSAIFLHVANKNYSPTKGCISVSRNDILFLIKKINKRTKLLIN